jgi:4-hydroxy-3-polyprenylbenzoate decarboxylase
MTDSSNDRRAAAIGDLREFLRAAEAEGELQVIDGADPNLEMGAIFELSLNKLFPPVLLFRNMKNCDPSARIVMNVRGSHFMVGDLDLAAVQRLRQRQKKGAPKAPIPPEWVDNGPIYENVLTGDEVDVFKFPAPVWHEDDGGPYLGTECIVLTKDPDSDWINVGTYRTEMHDKTTVTVFMEPGKHGNVIRHKYWERGQACPMVVCFGQAPVLGGVARVAYPPGVSELSIAGAQIGRPIRVVRSKLAGLPIPADAEVAFEGVVPPPSEETREEGPFGEWPGYYTSGRRPEPVLRVQAIYHRNDPIIIGQPPVRPTYPGRHTHIAGSAAIWDALENAGVPGIEGVWKLPAGGTRFINVVAINQHHPGHAKMAGLVATGCGPAGFMGRLTIVVDDDIDITDPAEVMWAMATRWDPKTATDIIDGCWSGYLDPTIPPEKRAKNEMTNSRMIVYATRPYHWKDQFPKVNTVSRDYAERVREKWKGQLRFLRDRPNGRDAANE